MLRGTRRDSLSGWAAFALPLALYIATLSPGVDFWDTGEMQTVPYVLGIAHPTGFPFFVLAGWVFSHAVPVRDPAWRISSLSALASAGAAWLCFVFVRDVTLEARVAAAAAVAFALGDVVWSRAVHAEVHDVALFFSALTLTAAARAGATRSSRALGMAALACGFGIATHPNVLLVLPGSLAFAWPALRHADAATRARVVALAIAPLALYAYVPLRSAYVEAHGLDPGVDIGIRGGSIIDAGAPSSLAAFVRYATAANFHPGATLVAALSRPGIAKSLVFARAAAYREDSYVMLGLALVGFVYFAIERRRLALGLSLVPALGTLFAANYAAESDAQRYALPALWTLGACAGVGGWWLAAALAGARPRLAASIAIAALGFALFPNAIAAGRDIARHGRIDDARALGPAIAKETPDGSLLVASWTFATPLAYETYVARSLGTRRLAIGWPDDFDARYPAWKMRFAHTFFVLDAAYDGSAFARPVYAAGRWRLWELRT